MRSEPPRGSGWVSDIVNCRFPIANWLLTRQPIGIWQLAIGNAWTHPLPRGGSDLIPLRAGQTTAERTGRQGSPRREFAAHLPATGYLKLSERHRAQR